MAGFSPLPSLVGAEVPSIARSLWTSDTNALCKWFCNSRVSYLRKCGFKMPCPFIIVVSAICGKSEDSLYKANDISDPIQKV